MTHQWDDGERFLDTIISYCTKCNAVRTRKAVEGLDYINTGTMALDMVGVTDEGWDYTDVPGDCIGGRGYD